MQLVCPTHMNSFVLASIVYSNTQIRTRLVTLNMRMQQSWCKWQITSEWISIDTWIVLENQSSILINTFGLENILMASSISTNFVSSWPRRVCDLSVSVLMGRDWSSLIRVSWSGGKCMQCWVQLIVSYWCNIRSRRIFSVLRRSSVGMRVWPGGIEGSGSLASLSSSSCFHWFCLSFKLQCIWIVCVCVGGVCGVCVCELCVYSECC